MSLTVSLDILKATQSNQLKRYRDQHITPRTTSFDHEVTVDAILIDDDGLDDLIAAANSVGDSKTVRAMEGIKAARSGEFSKPVPNFKAFKGMLESFLKADPINGWIYVESSDGKLYPELVTGVSYVDTARAGRDGAAHVVLHTTSYGLSTKSSGSGRILEIYKSHHAFHPQDVARRRIDDILRSQGIYKETAELFAAYSDSLARYHDIFKGAFSQQLRVSGKVYRFEDNHYRRDKEELSGRRVIHDLDTKGIGAVLQFTDTFIFDGDKEKEGIGTIPEHPLIKVFDLHSHEFFWAHSDNMTLYEYDKSLKDKLVLPKSHRDLLDVLTTNISAFISDIIEGKSAGNVILCKGIPGVGKTLTAEVYAELISKPLYSIHSGALGTSAQEIEKNLKEIFQRGKRWGCVLLLDEADVFVVRRGDNIVQNAIVAEFLRTLEYFDGLLFMTTNRPDNIDEAIISRCAAIIDYLPPTAHDAAAIWRVMATQYQAPLSDEIIGQLINLFPDIAPRDIKMLFRLALRVSAADGETLTIETFRRCAMFRAITMKQETGQVA
ncbi:TPA: ATP-binding protein [Aeromonas veronii]|nr:AAA family ATPase [Aeromonas veronii]